jgi:UDP-N-acetylglucosamine 2-epimerase (non-hydrolysing)
MKSHPPSVSEPYSILCVVGARPNFMKMAPIMAAFAAHKSELNVSLVHTGQHYDAAMNHQYFEALGIPQPDINLEVGSGSHTTQTANVMLRFETVLNTKHPSAILVVGDVNSTIACALVAAKQGIPVIHVEAGLRSFDRTMPEEINRVLTDQISDLLFITERSGRENLLREGIAEHRIRFVGNVMIDTLHHNLKKAVPVSQILLNAGKKELLAGHDGYAILTAHRPSNVDNPDALRSLLETILKINERLPIIFPVHPRTRDMIQKFGLSNMLNVPTLLQLPPMGYLEMLGLMKDAKVVLTDSGGIQEETTALGVPCITLRNNTERPITVDEGTNTIAGLDSTKIMAIFDDIMLTGGKSGRIPELWDGHASTRIATEIIDWLRSGSKSN